MTKSDLLPFASALSRHIMTAASALLVAHGVTILNSPDVMSQAVTFGTSALLGLASVGWSMLDKNATAAKAIEAVPTSTVSDFAGIIQDFEAKGRDPKVIAHLAQTLSVIAMAELQQFKPTDVEPMPDQATPVAPVAPEPPASVAPSSDAPLPAAAVANVAAGAFGAALQPMEAT